VDGYIANVGAPRLAYGGERACYSPGMDLLCMPQAETFDNAEAFYSTIFHEMTHSTGHPSRLDRKELLEFHSFGDESYSRGELVAENSSRRWALRC
jgi:antirestriction protein ArdC